MMSQSMRMNIFGISLIPEEFVSNEMPTKKSQKQNAEHELKIVWKNVIIFLYIHLAALYGLYLLCFRVKLWTFAWFFTIGISAGLGITAGAHRLWSHKSYKAKWPLRLILMIFQTIALQNHIYEWVRDHRVHHKFTDTDADPYNAKRGFFFSHIGWLLVRKHPDVAKRGSTIDCSDLEQDPLVVFQKKWYIYLMSICFILPTLIPYWMWGENLSNMWYINICRYCISLNATWLVNSAAHIWGMKPYDKSISSTNNVGVAFAAFGEGWHNYHHVFPWDYKSAELGNYRFNVTTAFIDFFALLGLAYDLKTVHVDVIKKRALRTGDAN